MLLASSSCAPLEPVQFGEPETLRARYEEIRRLTEYLCKPLAVEDYVIQGMPDVSPPKWHLAHTTWFFETFVLALTAGYRAFDPLFSGLFNSYYEGAGAVYPRARRGLLSRPTVDEVFHYRAYVDHHVTALLDNLMERENRDSIALLLVLGLNHEQQHQELLLTDIKYNFSINPLAPAYRDLVATDGSFSPPLEFIEYGGGLHQIGHAGDGFAYDNEGPRHRICVEPYRLANRPVTNAEFVRFIESGGYHESRHWLSDGWQLVKELGWEHPLYWRRIDTGWEVSTLGGVRPLDLHEPVCHVSFFEADAFARWAEKRLPTEAEWELAACCESKGGNFLGSGHFHPVGGELSAMFFGNIWQWTQSPYTAYPGFRALNGTLGEYNGKFMSNQMVLRGGSCVTPADHIRASYRNFFYPGQRWQFSGFRLAEAVI
ncbi:MAG: hypothetical protein FD165_236 [Gammaproteobacteria bacterium]|nr:MAG: hypothetical protein FD165_236 [Gammaproteobacteria bacterium]TND06814.1 MAG: TIGR03440 family protein [Gammaproteobacteria bacterium]